MKPSNNTVLIVEDDLKYRMIIKNAFEREGYRAITHHRREGVLELIEQYQPILVLIDIELQDDKLAGFKLARELEKYPVFYSYLSQHYNPQYIERSYRDDDYYLDYIYKIHFNRAEVATKIADLFKSIKTKLEKKEEEKINIGGYDIVAHQVTEIVKVANTNYTEIYVEFKDKPFRIYKSLEHCKEEFEKQSKIELQQTSRAVFINPNKIIEAKRKYRNNRTEYDVKVVDGKEQKITKSFANPFTKILKKLGIKTKK